MSLLRNAIRDVLRPAVKQLAGVSIRYRSIVDGETYPLDGGTITATLDNTATGEDIDDENFVFTHKSKDFKIDVREFHSFIPHAPQRNDVIEVVNGLGLPNQLFQVLDNGGTRAVEPLGNYEDVYRIQTKHIPNPEVTSVAYGNADGTQYGNADGTAYGSSRRP